MLTKAERTKQFIRETAAPLYNEKGISGVSIDDILAATKLTKGCIYGHFENKEALSEQVVEYSLKIISEKITIAVSQAKTAKGKLFAFLDFYKNPLQTIISGGCPIFNTAVEADDNFPAIKRKVASTIRSGQQRLSSILQEGISNGEFSSELNPQTFAFKLVAAIEGGIVLCRTLETAKPMLELIKDLKVDIERYSI